MAEVVQRLGSGAYRLSALRNSQSRPVRATESPGSLLVNGDFTDSRLKEDSTRNQREVRPAPRGRATQRKPEKLSRVRTSERQQRTVILCCDASVELNLSCLTRARHTAALQPVLQEKLLSDRMAPWTRGGVSIHRDTVSPQQLRALCTFIFLLTDQGSKRHVKLHPDVLQASSRSYSWRSDSKDAPLLYRSRTSYYDILKVSPAATQSQIKTAYYKQSFIYHPDKNPGNTDASQRFSEISEAYTVLGSITLRRRYDRGILSRSDVQNAGRPSSKETASRSTGSPQKQQQHRARRFSQTGGKTMFDFDAFYQAHYGEQLQREKELRARKQHMQEQQKKNLSKWRQGKMIEMTVVMLLTMAGLVLFNVSKP